MKRKGMRLSCCIIMKTLSTSSDWLQPPTLSSCVVVHTEVCTTLQQSKAVTQQSEQNSSHYAKHLCVIQISTCTLHKSVQNCSHYGKHCTLYKSVQNCSHYAKHCTLYKSAQNCSKSCTVTQRSGHKYSKASQAALDNTSVKWNRHTDFVHLWERDGDWEQEMTITDPDRPTEEGKSELQAPRRRVTPLRWLSMLKTLHWLPSHLHGADIIIWFIIIYGRAK